MPERNDLIRFPHKYRSYRTGVRTKDRNFFLNDRIFTLYRALLRSGSKMESLLVPIRLRLVGLIPPIMAGYMLQLGYQPEGVFVQETKILSWQL